MLESLRNASSGFPTHGPVVVSLSRSCVNLKTEDKKEHKSLHLKEGGRERGRERGREGGTESERERKGEMYLSQRWWRSL